MILDNSMIFCWEQAKTSSGAGSNGGLDGTGVLDLGAMDVFALNSDEGYAKIGAGENIYVVAMVTTAMNDTSGTPQYTVIPTLQTYYDSAFGGSTTILTMGTFAAGSKAGTMLIQRLPVSANYYRYLRMYFTLSGTLSAGKFSAFLAKDVDVASIYPSRITVD